MTHTIRAVRAEDWTLAKEIRLAALRDPAALIAFLETYDQAAAMPDEFWQGRAAGAAEALFRAALEWSWALPELQIERVRLYVHEDNARAEAMYEKVGFERTGATMSSVAGRELELAIQR
uniref:GNAT family N-acetyltransferase n=1 Tax=Paractinoplanes polyasparticus TaxID=2856853 RepID=UPI001C84727D|nr:GNAT family N-acetyltransferase [Actinoplanes polyasparticus]